MDRLKALFARAKEISDEMVRLETARDSREEKAFTDEERTAYKAAVASLEQVNDDIDIEQRSAKVKARTDEPQNAPRVPLEIHNVADEAPYAFGEMLQDIARATMDKTSPQPKRLDAHQKRNMEIVRKEFRMATGLNEAIPSDGGFLVGTDFAPTLIQKVYDNSMIAGMCDRIGIGPGANGLKINGVDETSRADGSRHGGVVGYWVAEGAALTGSKPKFRQIELNLKKDAVLFYATDELIQDASALGQVAETAVADEIQFMLQDAIIRGNGAGKPLGILNSPALVSVTKETGQPADTIVAKNISKMWAQAYGAGRSNSIWLVNQEVEPQLDELAIPVGTGGIPVYMPPGGLSDSPYGRLKGRPVVSIEQASAPGDVGDIILADFSQYILIDKGGVQMASSMHVQFTTDEMVYRFIYRVDGQPSWNAALTPYKGANDLSPFVALAARA